MSKNNELFVSRSVDGLDKTDPKNFLKKNFILYIPCPIPVQRMDWLRYIDFMIPPDKSDLENEITHILSLCSNDQTNDFYLSGKSPMGKTLNFDWLTNYLNDSEKENGNV